MPIQVIAEVEQQTRFFKRRTMTRLKLLLSDALFDEEEADDQQQIDPEEGVEKV